LSERWIGESEQLLRRMKELSSKEKRDRLEVINSLLFTLNILERSIQGWRAWIGNLSVMSQFSLEELTEIEQSLEKQTQGIIEYDVEATKKWIDKFPHVHIPERREPREEGREDHGMYV
jgi:hypothetical protein